MTQSLHQNIIIANKIYRHQISTSIYEARLFASGFLCDSQVIGKSDHHLDATNVHNIP